jgi:hypothetical protein
MKKEGKENPILALLEFNKVIKVDSDANSVKLELFLAKKENL